MECREFEEEVINLCKRLVSKQSYSGNEAGVVSVLSEYMNRNGFDEVSVDKYGNIIGKLIGKRPGKTLLFDGHIDTVPVGSEDDWIHKPFEPEICGGKLFGRGTSDMKGAVAAYTVAAANFAKACNKDFSGEIVCDGVVHEECFEGVAARNITELVNPDVVIIGEASDCNIKIGQRGRAEIVLETFGKPAHSANPEKGINAVYKMCNVIEKIRELEPTEHPVLGKGILELTDIKSAPYPGASVVPEYCRATYDRRLLVGETKESVLKPLQMLLEQMMIEDSELEAKVSFAYGREKCHTGEVIEGERFFPGWLFDENNETVSRVIEGLKRDGYCPEITKYNFCTNGSHYAGEKGILTFGMGPSNESLAHIVDEYCEIAELKKVSGCYYSILKSLMDAN